MNPVTQKNLNKINIWATNILCVLRGHISNLEVAFNPGQLMFFVKFHHPGHDAQVKVGCRPAAPKLFVSSCGSKAPFNYCGTTREGGPFGFKDDKQIAGSLRLCMHVCVCICEVIFRNRKKKEVGFSQRLHLYCRYRPMQKMKCSTSKRSL